MDIRLHENGWTVFVDDFDLKNLNVEQAHVIAKYLLTNEVVVFKNQKLTPEDQIRICSLFGEVEDYKKSNYSDHLLLKDAPETKILRVTGELDEHGQPGVGGWTDEFEWHCNRVSDPNRLPIVWLYGVKGTKGSRTSWLNNIVSYNDFSDEKKKELQKLKLNVGGTVQFTDYLWDEGVAPPSIDDYKPNLVYTNGLGVTGLYFSWNQIHFIDGMDPEESKKLIEDLRQSVEKQEYIYDHDWEDGDVILSEQWLSIHKRWAFDDIDKRLLHRLTMNLSNIDMDKIKT